MKKILTIMTYAVAMLSIASCDWFVLDNQEGYNATVYGNIIDSKTGEAVYQQQGDGFSIYEKVSGGQAYIGRDWSKESAQSWAMKANGTYVNRLVFAGDYHMNTLNGNFVADDQDFVLKKGENKVDFKVTPYVRIKDVKISVSGTKYVATFKVETDLPESTVNNIGEVRFCCFTDRFVGNSKNNCTSDKGAIKTNIDPKGNQTITLEIDTKAAANSYEFQYKRAHYVRVAAIGAHYSIVPEHTEVTYETDWEEVTRMYYSGETIDWGNLPTKEVKTYYPAEYKNDGKSNTSNKYNYSAVFKIDENGTVSEVTDWGDVK